MQSALAGTTSNPTGLRSSTDFGTTKSRVVSFAKPQRASSSSQRFVESPGTTIVSRNPARPDQIIWRGGQEPALIDAAVRAARVAFTGWSDQTLDQRALLLQRWAEIVTSNAQRIAESTKVTPLVAIAA